MNRPVLIGLVVGAVFCGGLGTCSSVPAVISLMSSIDSGYYTNLPPFAQGQMFGRILGGPCSGLFCGGMGGVIVGVLVQAARKKQEA